MSPRTLLLLAVAAVAIVWRLPHGQMLLYPFSLLATYAHEMGHGLAALLVGAEFDQLVLHADGSGQALWRGAPGPSALALVAAAGLLGPTLAGAALLALSRSPRRARLLLALLAGLMTLSVLIWARNGFAIGFLLAMSALFAAAARWLPDLAAALLLRIVAVLLCLSWYQDLDYLFSEQAMVGGAAYPSDTAVIAQALLLPYWFWGGLIAAVSLTCLGVGLWWASRGERKGD